MGSTRGWFAAPDGTKQQIYRVWVMCVTRQYEFIGSGGTHVTTTIVLTAWFLGRPEIVGLGGLGGPGDRGTLPEEGEHFSPHLLRRVSRPPGPPTRQKSAIPGRLQNIRARRGAAMPSFCRHAARASLSLPGRTSDNNIGAPGPNHFPALRPTGWLIFKRFRPKSWP